MAKELEIHLQANTAQDAINAAKRIVAHNNRYEFGAKLDIDWKTPTRWVVSVVPKSTWRKKGYVVVVVQPYIV